MVLSKLLGSAAGFVKNVWSTLSAAGKFIRLLKIQQRLIISFLILSILPLMFMGAISYSKSNAAIASRISIYSSELMRQTTRNLMSEFTKFEQLAKDLGYSDTVQNMFSGMKKQNADEKLAAILNLSKFLREKTSSYNDILEAAIANGTADDEQLLATAKAISADDIKRIIDAAKASRGGPAWIPARGTDGVDRLVTARELNFTQGGGKLGVIFIAIDAKHFSDIYSEMNLGKGSEMFILDLNGLVLSSSSEKTPVNENYADGGFVTRLEKNREAEKITFAYNESLAAYDYIESNKWYVVALIPFSYINAAGSSILFSVILLFVIFLIISIILSFIVADSISLPLKKLVNAMNEARGGNLAIQLDDLGGDEIGLVTRNFNKMLENIRILISKASMSSRRLKESLEQIQASAAASYTASDQIAATMQEIAAGANEQARQVLRGVEYTNKLAGDISIAEGNVAGISKLIDDTMKLSENGLSAVRLLNEKASETNSITNKVSDEVNSLNDDLKQIRRIVNLIGSIAEQTNLLSLNASIEAARAGEAGKGFMVVASEVKKLADKSKESSAMINTIIESIRQKAGETVEAANNGSAVAREQMQAVGMTDAAFKKIYDAMGGIAAYMANVQQSMIDMLTAKDDTVRVMESISTVTEEAAATTQEISAGTEVQKKDAQELSKLADKLSDMARELEEAISIFRIE